jgi:hypothetical protein
MKTTIDSSTENAACQAHVSEITDVNSSELGNPAPCIGDDPHEANCTEF